MLAGYCNNVTGNSGHINRQMAGAAPLLRPSWRGEGILHQSENGNPGYGVRVRDGTHDPPPSPTSLAACPDAGTTSSTMTSLGFVRLHWCASRDDSQLIGSVFNWAARY